MTFNRNDFLDWAKVAQGNPMSNQYRDFEKEFVNPTTNSEISAINNILDGGKNIIGKDKNIFRTDNKLPLEEAFPREVSTPLGKLGADYADKSGYLKPSRKQLKTAIDTKKDDSPIFKHQGTEIRPSDVQAKARDKRIAKIAKRTRPMDSTARRAGSIVGRIFGKK